MGRADQQPDREAPGTRSTSRGRSPTRSADSADRGDFGRPVLKPAIWTWEIPALFLHRRGCGHLRGHRLWVEPRRATPELVRDARHVRDDRRGAVAAAPDLRSRPSRALSQHAERLQAAESDVGRRLAGRVLCPRARLGGWSPAGIRPRQNLCIRRDTAAVSGLVLATYSGVLHRGDRHSGLEPVCASTLASSPRRRSVRRIPPRTRGNLTTR